MTQPDPSSQSRSPRHPSGRPSAAQIEAALIALYGWANWTLLSGVARILAGTPFTLIGTQAAVGPMRRLVAEVNATLQVRTDPLIASMVQAITETAEAQAAADVAEAEHLAATQDGTRGSSRSPEQADPLVNPHPSPKGTGDSLPPPPGGTPGTGLEDRPEFFDLSKPHGERAAEAIRRDLSSSLANVRERITRLPDDVYKAVAPHGAVLQVLDNGLTPRQSQAAAWRTYLARGVTGFTDRSGRRWNLATYTEMAVRTAAMRAHNDAHLQYMRALGIRFFQVPSHDTTCPLCFPWQGQVLTEGIERVEPGTPVAGTIADATAAGLFHPNCRHTLIPFLPGISEPPPPPQVWDPTMQEHYDQEQRQRALERRVRAAKVQASLALDPVEARAAGRRVRAAQAAVRQHLEGKPYLSRRSHREQPNLGYATVRVP